MSETTPPMPASQEEWEAHWAFYKLTVLRRDEAWAENTRLVEAIQKLARLVPTVQHVSKHEKGKWKQLYERAKS